MASDRRNERGSSLILMPAAVLVLFVLAAIAVDQSLVFMRQRELAEAAQAAANDAAGAGLDVDSFYRGDRIEFDLDQARAAAKASLLARGIADPPAVTLDPAHTRVVVVVRSSVEPLFAAALPGSAATTEVRGQASATLIER